MVLGSDLLFTYEELKLNIVGNTSETGYNLLFTYEELKPAKKTNANIVKQDLLFTYEELKLRFAGSFAFCCV